MTLPPQAVRFGLTSSIELPRGDANRGSSWFALFTYPRHEKKVAENLLARDIEPFLPLYEQKRTWKNRQTVNLAVPLFPSYVFARFSRQQRIRVLSLPGVVNIVDGARNAGAIPEHYIETLRRGIELGRIRPFREPVLGDRVRIKTGPLAGVEGVLVHFRSEFRLVLSIAMIGQSVSIEVGRDEIEAAPSCARGMA